MPLYFSLFAGLLVAFALQLLLTNLGVALGLTVLGGFLQPKTAPAEDPSSEPEAARFSPPILHLVGFGVATTLSTVLFAAAWLATEFSQIIQPRRGALLGVILWAAYLLVFAWLSSTTISSVADSVLGTVAAGGRRLISALRQAIAPNQPDPAPLKSMAAELEQVAAFQQRLPDLLEDQQDILLAEVREIVGNQLGKNTQTNQTAAENDGGADFDGSNMSGANLGNDGFSSAISAASTSGALSQLMPDWRGSLRRLLNRIDWSDWDLEALWQKLQSQISEDDTQAAILADAEEYLRYTPLWALHPSVLKADFAERIYDIDAAPDAVLEQLEGLTRSHFTDWLRQRGDVAEDKIEAVADQLVSVYESVKGKVQQRLQGEERGEEGAEGAGENSQAEPRDDRQTKVMAADLQDSARSVVKQEDAAESAEEASALAELQDKLVAYCRYTNLDKLSVEGLEDKLRSQLEEQNLLTADGLALGAFAIDFAVVEETLSRRQGLLAEQRSQLIDSLKSNWKSLQPVTHLQKLSRPPRRWAKRAGRSTQTFLSYLQTKLTQYLQFQDKSAFTPAQIAQDMANIFKSGLRFLPSFSDLAGLIPDLSIDQQAWQQALEKRRDLTAAEIQQLLNWLDTAWQQATEQLATWGKDLYDQLSFNPGQPIAAVRQQLIDITEAAQAQLQAQAAEVTAEVQRQANAVRRQVAIAAWWLFISLLTSGVAAGTAGWIAVIY